MSFISYIFVIRNKFYLMILGKVWVSFNIKVLSELKIKVTFASCIKGLELKKNFN